MFTFIDVIFIIIILLIAIHGAINGFVVEFFGKAAVILGVFLSIILYEKLTPYINPHVKSLFLSNLFSFLLIFVIVYLVVKIIQHFVGNFFENEIMGGLDHTIGFFLGIVEGLLLVSVLFVLLYAQPWFNVSSFFKDSFFHQKLETVLVAPTQKSKEFFESPQKDTFKKNESPTNAEDTSNDNLDSTKANDSSGSDSKLVSEVFKIFEYEALNV